MKKINIKIVGLGIGEKAQGIITICQKGKKIFENKTYNGEIYLKLKEKEAYSLNIYSMQGNKHIYFYVDKNINKYVFSLFNSIKIVTFQLTDANYYNLPIEKGELLLWIK